MRHAAALAHALTRDQTVRFSISTSRQEPALAHDQRYATVAIVRQARESLSAAARIVDSSRSWLGRAPAGGALPADPASSGTNRSRSRPRSGAHSPPPDPSHAAGTPPRTHPPRPDLL